MTTATTHVMLPRGCDGMRVIVTAETRYAPKAP